MRASSFVAGLAVSSVVLFGCPSQSELCKSGADQVCERVFECTPEANRSAPQFQAVWGTSVDNCKALLYANPRRPQNLLGDQTTGIACDDVKNDDELCTNITGSGGDFNLGEASKCSDARAELSCADYMAQLSDPSKAPASCAERCK